MNVTAMDLDSWVLQPALCITAVGGSTPDDVEHAFGVEDGAAPIAVEDLDDEPAVGVVKVGGGVLAVEFDGYQGSRPEVLRRASAGARAGSVCWNVRGLVTTGLAENGTVLCTFDSDAPGQRRGSDPEILDALASGLDLGKAERQVECVLLVVQRFSGVSFDANDVLGIMQVHPLLPVSSDPPDADEGRGEGWWPATVDRVDDEELALLILTCDAQQARAFALWAATQALDATELLGEAPIALALENARAGQIGQLDRAADSLIRRVDRDSSRAERLNTADRATRAIWARYHATEALLAAASSPDPITAAVDAAGEARLTFAGSVDQWLRRARAQLK